MLGSNVKTETVPVEDHVMSADAADASAQAPVVRRSGQVAPAVVECRGPVVSGGY